MRYLLILLVLAGCASSAKYDQKLTALVGTPFENLVLEWGAPTSVIKLSTGRTVAEYLVKDDIQLTSDDGKFTQTISSHCKTTFIIDAEGKVQAYKFEGDKCVD